MFQIYVAEKIKKHIFYSITFFGNHNFLYDNVEKHRRAGQVVGDNIAHAQCMLDT